MAESQEAFYVMVTTGQGKKLLVRDGYNWRWIPMLVNSKPLLFDLLHGVKIYCLAINHKPFESVMHNGRSDRKYLVKKC
jgi:hypothetical protein